MPSVRIGRLYLDSNGVQRGYYVYLHRVRDTGKVFYVGKGCGKRAWEQKKRHKQWRDKVRALGDDWEVVIVNNDLSELEAFELERDLVCKYGGAVCDGGTLLNRVPGGEDPLSVRITVSRSKAGQAWMAAYEQSRRFKEPERNEQEQIAQQLHAGLQSIIANLDDLREAHNDDEGLEDSAMDVDCIVGSQIDCIKDFLRRRISWKLLSLSVEEMLDDLDSDDIKQLHQKVQPFASQAVTIAARMLREIDSGNRLEAEQFGDCEAKRVEMNPGFPSE